MKDEEAVCFVLCLSVILVFLGCLVDSDALFTNTHSDASFLVVLKLLLLLLLASRGNGYCFERVEWGLASY